MNGSDTKIWSERWRLAALNKDELTRIGLLSAVMGLIYVLFHLQGNTTDTGLYGRSAILWMVARWRDSGLSFGGADYSHGALIPFVSAFVVWYRRKEIAAAPKYISKMGLAVVVTALLTHWLGAKAQQVRVSLFSLILLLWGVPFYLFGWQVAKQLIFPAAYLIFCIPLNFLEEQSAYLKIIMASGSEIFLNGIGIAVDRTGSIVVSQQDLFRFNVDDPCSGLRSLLALMALAAAYASFTQKTLRKKWLLFLSAIPLAMIGNMARIITIAVMAQAFGEELAAGLYHDFSGYVIFMVITIPLLIGFGSMLNTNYREVLQRWKAGLLSPTT